MPDGITPASNAIIQFYEIGDTTTLPTHQTSTDIDGRYSIKDVTSGSGYFNVIAEYNDSLFTMQDTVFISPETHYVKDDTLNDPGSISGIVALQPNHSHLLDNVYVIALGMGRAINVNSTGWFTLSKLPQGDYNLQVDTDIENYGPKFVDVSIASGIDDSVADTITLPYNGIPVITGLSSTYDTLNAVLTLSWNKSSYGDISNYLIFRKSSDSLFFPDIPIGWVSSAYTSYNDTIFHKPVTDTNTKFYNYTVAILDSGTTPGPIHSYIQDTAVSPLEVTSIISIQTYNKSIILPIDTISTTDTAQLILSVSNKNRPYKSISWAINHPDSVTKHAIPDSTLTYAKDTLEYSCLNEGEYPVYIDVIDMAGTSWRDTTIISVWNKPEPVNLFLDSIFARTAYIRWSKNTDTDFYSYSILVNKSIVDTTSNINDTTFTINDLSSNTNYSIEIIVTDNSGLQRKSVILR